MIMPKEERIIFYDEVKNPVLKFLKQEGLQKGMQQLFLMLYTILIEQKFEEEKKE
ncbi:MAG: hypothetical protein DDT33_00995 [Firmicutes bacterium]|nr:hypothetical protein [Bacillota bacterium]